jgi:hypothetical protein
VGVAFPQRPPTPPPTWPGQVHPAQPRPGDTKPVTGDGLCLVADVASRTGLVTTIVCLLITIQRVA